jgi:hypothetical protein
MNVKMHTILPLFIISLILLPTGISSNIITIYDNSIIPDNPSENPSWIIIPTQIIDCDFNLTVIVYSPDFELCVLVNNEKTYKFIGPCLDYIIASGENISLTYWSIDAEGFFEPKQTTIVKCDTKFDSTPPNINMINPKDAIYINDMKIINYSHSICIGKITIRVDAFDSHSGIRIITYEFSNGDTGYDIDPPYSYIYDRLYFGMITVKITAYNGAGLTTSTSCSFFKLL